MVVAGAGLKLKVAADPTVTVGGTVVHVNVGAVPSLVNVGVIVKVGLLVSAVWQIESVVSGVPPKLRVKLVVLGLLAYAISGTTTLNPAAEADAQARAPKSSFTKTV